MRRSVASWVVLLVTVSVPGARVVAAEADSLKGEVRQIHGITATVLQLDGVSLIPCLFWDSDEGHSFVALDAQGVIRRISYPDFKVLRKTHVPRHSSWLCPSAQGLVLTVPTRPQVWLLDAQTFDVKSKIDARGITTDRVVSAPNLSVAVGTSPTAGQLGIIDLKSGKTDVRVPVQYIDRNSGRGPDKFPLSASFRNPVISPNGKYLFTSSGDAGAQLCKFHLDGGKFKFDDVSAPVGVHGFVAQFSPDSKRVCLPGGNYVTPIFLTASLTRPVCTLKLVPGPNMVAFDPVSGWIYANSGGHELVLFTPQGVMTQRYKLRKNSFGVRQYLVHPDGGKLLVLMNPKPYWIELRAGVTGRSRRPRRADARHTAPAVATAADAFTAGAVWVNHARRITLTVLERDGERFRARFQIAGAVDREVTGEVKGDSVSWLAKDARAFRGSAGGDNSGVFGKDRNGSKIDFTWRSANGAHGSYTLRRQKAM